MGLIEEIKQDVFNLNRRIDGLVEENQELRDLLSDKTVTEKFLSIPALCKHFIGGNGKPVSAKTMKSWVIHWIEIGEIVKWNPDLNKNKGKVTYRIGKHNSYSVSENVVGKKPVAGESKLKVA